MYIHIIRTANSIKYQRFNNHKNQTGNCHKNSTNLVEVIMEKIIIKIYHSKIESHIQQRLLNKTNI